MLDAVSKYILMMFVFLCKVSILVDVCDCKCVVKDCTLFGISGEISGMVGVVYNGIEIR